jgi:hypothetical protein
VAFENVSDSLSGEILVEDRRGRRLIKQFA